MSGIYFGDRCSPVSTSALLVSELTQTDIFSNIKKMIQTALGPFILTCMIYVVMGMFGAAEVMIWLCPLLEWMLKLR